MMFFITYCQDLDLYPKSQKISYFPKYLVNTMIINCCKSALVIFRQFLLQKILEYILMFVNRIYDRSNHKYYFNSQQIYYRLQIYCPNFNLPPQNNYIISIPMNSIKVICFAILYKVSTCQQATGNDISQAQAWGLSFVITFGLSVVGFLAALLIISIKNCMQESTFKTFINMLYSLGCGAMVGDAMIHILPDSYSNPQANFRFVSLIFICSIVFFIAMERVLHLCGLSHSHWGDEGHHHSEEGHEHKNGQHKHSHDHKQQNQPCQQLNKNKEELKKTIDKKKVSDPIIELEDRDQIPKQNDIKENSIVKQQSSIIQMNVQEAGRNKTILQTQAFQMIKVDQSQINNPEQNQQKKQQPNCLQRLKGKGSAGYLNILSSFLHNFFDGFAVGAAFSSLDKTQYVPVVIAIFAHQIPREMGDVAILIKNRFNVCQTIVCNVVVNLTSLIGVLAGVGLGSISEAVQIYILSFVAGNFIYIGADIWRNLLKNKDACTNILQILSFSVGVGAMYCVLLAQT